jgi:hypothetical protein
VRESDTVKAKLDTVEISFGTPLQPNIFRMALGTLNLNSVNQLIFVMVKCGVLFEVRTEFLNNI